MCAFSELLFDKWYSKIFVVLFATSLNVGLTFFVILSSESRFTAITMFAPWFSAACTGTGSDSCPSMSTCLLCITGEKTSGIDMLALIAVSRFPFVKYTGSPVFRLVLTVTRGVFRSLKLVSFSSSFR